MEVLHDLYRSLMAAGHRPNEIDEYEITHVGLLFGPDDDVLSVQRVTTRNAGEVRKAAIDHSSSVAAESEIARREGRSLAPAGVSASDPKIAEALAEARRKRQENN